VNGKIGGVERDYELSIPPGYNGATKAPLLLSLHGFTSNIGQEDSATRFPTEAGKRGYVVVTPQAPNVAVPLKTGTVDQPLWNISGAFTPPSGSSRTLQAGDDVAYVNSLLHKLETTLCIDKSREYVSGISNGAGMTVVLICEDDQRFAAAAPVAGVNMATICDAKHATPIIAFHGTADPLVNYNGGSLFGLNLGLPPVEQRMANLAKLGGCEAHPSVTRPHADIRHVVWNCPPTMGAELYTIIGAGHTWPGAPIPGATAAHQAVLPQVGRETLSIDATNLILDFFDQHHRST